VVYSDNTLGCDIFKVKALLLLSKTYTQSIIQVLEVRFLSNFSELEMVLPFETFCNHFEFRGFY
jgi:hypothetical protein